MLLNKNKNYKTVIKIKMANLLHFILTVFMFSLSGVWQYINWVLNLKVMINKSLLLENNHEWCLGDNFTTW